MKEQIDANRAALSVARKLARRAYHILSKLGEQGLAPVDDLPLREQAALAA